MQSSKVFSVGETVLCIDRGQAGTYIVGNLRTVLAGSTVADLKYTRPDEYNVGNQARTVRLKNLYKITDPLQIDMEQGPYTEIEICGTLVTAFDCADVTTDSFYCKYNDKLESLENGPCVTSRYVCHHLPIKNLKGIPNVLQYCVVPGELESWKYLPIIANRFHIQYVTDKARSIDKYTQRLLIPLVRYKEVSVIYESDTTEMLRTDTTVFRTKLNLIKEGNSHYARI